MDGILNGLRAILDTGALNPHGICLLWRPELVWTHAVSDVLIGLAYFSIPVALGVFLHHRRDVRFGWAIWLFVLFIMLCGVTHFMMVWTLWNPDYGVEALIKAATAAASIITAIALWPLLPKVIATPSAHALQARIEERDAALAELHRLMASMVRMEEHTREQSRLLDEVNRSESRLRSIFENAAVGIARVGIDGQFLELNDRFEQIAGWPREQLLAGGFQRITHHDDLEADLAQVEALLRGDYDSYAMEKRYVRSGGGIVWVHLTCSTVRDASGTPDHFVAIIDDISEAKRTEQTRDLLMREVDHRARNALTVVQSVVRLTNGEPDQFKETVAGRVDALARAQASLAKTNWRGAFLAEVVSQELSFIADPAQVTIEGPPIHVEPEQVQPLSMVLHELATNAAKHGALSAPGGRIFVAWRPNDQGWTLTWREDGGPPVEAPTSTGFGSRLIRNLARELGGSTQLHWRPTGLQFEMVVATRRAEPGQTHAFIGALSRGVPSE